MTTKQHILTHKPWSHTGNASVAPAGIIAKLVSMIKIEVPVGYQDETGFHYGSKSVGKAAK